MTLRGWWAVSHTHDLTPEEVEAVKGQLQAATERGDDVVIAEHGLEFRWHPLEQPQTVGWVVQTRTASDEDWLSWTQWRLRERAEQQLADLLRVPKHAEGRLVRVDWTVVE